MKKDLFTISPEDVTDELILKRCRNPKDALKLCRDCSPLSDDEIIGELAKRSGRKEMQNSHFTECFKDSNRNFPPELIQTLEDICENWIPTRYMALSRNQELKPKKEAWELENEQLRAELAEKEMELDIIRKWENGKKK